MKYLLLFLPIFCNATKFVVTPSMTMVQVNALPAVAGDSVVFQTSKFFGQLVIKNGVHYIGNGSVISGMTDVTGWTQVKPNIWEASGTSDVLTVNGVYYPYGHTAWANYSAASQTNLSDSHLTGSWIGAEVVMRKQPWIVDRFKVTGQGTGTLSLSSLTSLPDAAKGSHYFIQNHIDCLSKPGDWASNGKIDLYSTSIPTGVQIATVAVLVEGTGKSGATLDGFAFIGSTGNMVNIPNSSNLTFTNCSFTYSGENGFYVSTSANLSIQNCSFETIANDGILGNLANSKVVNCSFHMIGMYEGMTMMRGNTSSSATAIKAIGDGNTFSGNLMVKTGYNAIDFKGSNLIITANRIDSFCLAKDDGGAIYTWNGEKSLPSIIYSNRVIEGNIITNGLAPADLNDRLTNGLYMDDNTNNVTLKNNFIQNVTFKGIYLHNAHEITVTGNVSIGAGFSAFAISHGSGKDQIKNITLSKNVFIQTKVTDGNVFSFETNADSIKFFGSSDLNTISCIGKETAVCYTSIGTVYTHYSLSSWAAKYGFDGGSVGSGITDATKLVYTLSSTRPFTFISGAFPVDTTKPVDTVIVTPPPPPVIYKNVAQSKTFTRNNCGTGTGSSVVYTVPAGTYQGTSQAEADGKATNDIQANGQNYANLKGTCSTYKCSFWDKIFNRHGCK